VARRADEANRSGLLDRIVSYALMNGVAALSLRPLAKDLGVSAAALIYHFGSKEELTVEILKHAGDSQRALFASMHVGASESPRDICREVWRVIGAPQARPLFRLFFEVYGLALIDPGRFPGFFPNAITNWLDFLERTYVSDGCDARAARVRATIVIAGFRGFLLDVCATGDDERVASAVELWLETLP
jgi:AcrR family transcriptional regulator